MRLGPYFEEGGASGAGTVTIAPPAPDTSATPAAPRDPQTGRFAKANIERAATGFQDESQQSQPIAATPAPAAPAVAAAPPPAADAAPEGLAAIDAFIAAQPAGEAPTPTPAPAAAAPAPADTPEVRQQVQQLAAKIEAHDRLNNALNSGNIDDALKVFAPQAIAAIEEHFYQTKKDQWAKRFADEASGIQRDPEVEVLKRQLAAVTQFIQNGQQQFTQTQQQQAEQARVATLAKSLGTYMDTMFDAVKLKDSPQRMWIEGALRTEVGKNPQALANIQAGRFGDIGRTFRELYPKFQPLLTAAVTTPAPAGQPAGSTALMASPAGTSTTQPPANDLVNEQGGINGKGIVRRLRALVS